MYPPVSRRQHITGIILYEINETILRNLYIHEFELRYDNKAQGRNSKDFSVTDDKCLRFLSPPPLFFN